MKNLRFDEDELSEVIGFVQNGPRQCLSHSVSLLYSIDAFYIAVENVCC